MERIFALIQGSTVVNAIVADDAFIEDIKDDYTNIIEVTDRVPRPSVGATYLKDEDTFIPARSLSVEEPVSEVTE